MKPTSFHFEIIQSTKLKGTSSQPNEITDNLFLSSMEPANDIEVLESLQITHVLIVGNHLPRMGLEQQQRLGIIYKQFWITDTIKENMLSILPEAIEFIESALNQNNGKILVHCAAGVSRSASVVISYLMTTMEISVREAFQYVKRRRPIIGPNRGFMRQLRLFEKSIFDRNFKYVEKLCLLELITVRNTKAVPFLLINMGIDPEILLENIALVRDEDLVEEMPYLSVFNEGVVEIEVFSCVECERMLFVESNVKKRSENAFFIERMQWMDKDSLSCPNCGVVLGLKGKSGFIIGFQAILTTNFLTNI